MKNGSGTKMHKWKKIIMVYQLTQHKKAKNCKFSFAFKNHKTAKVLFCCCRKEMRKRKFENWMSRKSESARKERRKTEQLEQIKLEEMQKDYAQWKSRPRVMSFEEWRRRKQNEIR